MERRGTCSTKHALLRRLAIEQGFDLKLILGIYKMTELNTPGVGSVLRRHGLDSLPEAHCFLESSGRRIDVTKMPAKNCGDGIGKFLYEEEIEPDRIMYYKITVHKKLLEKWIVERSDRRRFSLDDVWAIREECIASLCQ